MDGVHGHSQSFSYLGSAQLLPSTEHENLLISRFEDSQRVDNVAAFRFRQCHILGLWGIDRSRLTSSVGELGTSCVVPPMIAQHVAGDPKDPGTIGVRLDLVKPPPHNGKYLGHDVVHLGVVDSAHAVRMHFVVVLVMELEEPLL